MPGPGLQLEAELDAEKLKLGRGAAQHRAGAARRGVSLLAHREPPPARAKAPFLQAACLRLPPPSISPESQPGAPAPGFFFGWEAPGRSLVSLLPRSLGSQLPFFFSWTGSHPLRSPSFSSGSLLLPLARVPAAQPLFSAEGPRLPFSLPGVPPILFLPLSLGCRLSPPPPSFPGLEFQTFWSLLMVLNRSWSLFPSLAF